MADEKDALIEKITFALLPLLFSCVVYLMSAALTMIKYMSTYIKNYFLKYEQQWIDYWSYYGGPK